MTGESETSVQGMPEARALRYIDLSRTTFASDAAALLPEETARRYRAVPIERRGEVTLVAVASPANPITMGALRDGAGCDVTTVVASPDQVTMAIAYLYGGGSARSSRRRGQHVAGDELDGADGPMFDAVRFATSEALLSAPGFDDHGFDGERTNGTGTLEESLRSVLVPPEVDRDPPSAPDAPLVEIDDSLTPAAPDGTPSNGTSANGTSANGTSANGTAANGLAADRGSVHGVPGDSGTTTSGTTTNGTTTNGMTPSTSPATGAAANGAAVNGAASNGAAVNGAASNGSAPDGAATKGPRSKEGAADNGAPAVAQDPNHEGAPNADPEGATSRNGHGGSVSTSEPAGSDLGPMKDASSSKSGVAHHGQKSAHPAAPRGGRGTSDERQDTREPAGDPLGAPAAADPPTAAVEPPTTAAHTVPAPVAEAPTAEPVVSILGQTEAGAPPPPPPGFGSVEADPEVEAAAVHWPPLARVLVRAGKISFDQMVQALRAHREAGEPLGRYLFTQKLATEDDLVQAMAEEVGLEFVDLTAYPIDPNVATLIPESVARRHMVLALRLEDGVPVVAMANPTDVFAMDDLRSIMGRHFTPVVATRSQIDLHLRQLQETSGGDMQEAAQSAAGQAVPAGGGFELESLQSVVEDAPIVRYVNLLILQALNERASDIHIEPTPKRLRIRFRIDGVMHDASSASPAIHQAVISRLKVLGEMDITEHRVPQEGRVSVSVGERQIDLRLAILPSQFGETCVMRLLDKSASIRRLSELGFFPDTLERYSQAYTHPYGVILVTGPTGAGKTTTLYATLQEVMSSEKSVVTVEDPVEYQIDGITQVQINAKVGLHFSTALRSILRADPDIILVGEIRDIETASIAMEAALSGHLVLSTLHTNTAASTPLRLTEMGIEPFLVTSAVGGVLTQRLARILCEKCKTPYSASLTDFYAAGYREVDLEGLDVSTLYRAAGCRTCSHTGYHGRMILAEVMPMTEEIERMIIEQQSIVAIERQAAEQGMRTLRQDGLRKALAGFTTLEEVLRVVV